MKRFKEILENTEKEELVDKINNHSFNKGEDVYKVHTGMDLNTLKKKLGKLEYEALAKRHSIAKEESAAKTKIW